MAVLHVSKAFESSKHDFTDGIVRKEINTAKFADVCAADPTLSSVQNWGLFTFPSKPGVVLISGFVEM